MRCPVENDADREEATKLNAEPWMFELLDLNPSYPHWGPYEDYMSDRDSGWRSRVIEPTWDGLAFKLDDLNEVVHFYFSVNRDSKQCPVCEGNGYHPDAQAVANSFYAHMNPRGEQWNDKITDDEAKALWDEGRLRGDFKKQPSGSEVNRWQKGPGMGHDGINRWILVRARLKRLGLPETCPECDGNGYVFTAPAAHVSLTLWVLHPRKGASRGVEVQRIEQSELPDVFAYLREARDRNAARFAAIPA